MFKKAVKPFTFTWPYTHNWNAKLTGDFDQWTRSLQMNRQADGSWSLTLDLDSTRDWDFKFEIDGEWQYDSAQPFHYSRIKTINNFVLGGPLGPEDFDEYENEDGTFTYLEPKPRTLVYFNWPYPNKLVHVTGKFDGWRRSVPMNKLEDGTWELGVNIDPTREWDYKFDVDGEWTYDSAKPYHLSLIGSTNNYREATTFEEAVEETKKRGLRDEVKVEL
ncbi:hypothetical protein HK096_009759 [Nowakowskiella sp. JEL0078]|nr:hypothetical protein HK096_009759 [Nowakowskiella sp. JEL0078]